MSAPTRPRPPSLMRLIRAPGIGVGSVQAVLETVFPRVIAECRADPFFQFQIRCVDESGRNRLIVGFGWCQRQNRWIFKPLPGDRA